MMWGLIFICGKEREVSMKFDKFKYMRKYFS